MVSHAKLENDLFYSDTEDEQDSEPQPEPENINMVDRLHDVGIHARSVYRLGHTMGADQATRRMMTKDEQLKSMPCAAPSNVTVRIIKALSETQADRTSQMVNNEELRMLLMEMTAAHIKVTAEIANVRRYAALQQLQIRSLTNRIQVQDLIVEELTRTHKCATCHTVTAPTRAAPHDEVG
jgi:hypothetical protein